MDFNEDVKNTLRHEGAGHFVFQFKFFFYWVGGRLKMAHCPLIQFYRRDAVNIKFTEILVVDILYFKTKIGAHGNEGVLQYDNFKN